MCSSANVDKPVVCGGLAFLYMLHTFTAHVQIHNYTVLQFGLSNQLTPTTFV